MVVAKASYEELRRRRLQENKKRMEELHLPLLSQALKKHSSPKPSPVTYERFEYTRRNLSGVYKRDLSNRVYASDEARAMAITRAEELESVLGADYPTFVRPMLPSHVTGGFWLGLPSHFCNNNLPRNDGTLTLVDEEGEEYPTVYLARKVGLSGGWRGFSIEHGLVDGDALVFQLIQPTKFKVYIVRANSCKEDDDIKALDV
ncbi:B3 domain-containing protein Os06g0194400-like isoform X2 [Actinidia eriantha]|uniref:B3 domain-containing protein Os06g0194400-like isoform X2 n=1 Tax=Actinidia eriantha TaxID=165200 RepID=UPI00258C9CC2|nr:B3 domain-containing protein Os06g0194400-like isoform X2 [Actinidia eriantha]